MNRSDAVILLLLSLFSIALSLPGLGFYSDDWAFLGLASNAPKQTLGSVFEALFPSDRMRPVAWLYRAALYRAFGLHPLPYHVVNSLVLAACVLLLYRILVHSGAGRAHAFAAAALYAVLPHYTALRFWYGGGFNASLSIALYLGSLSADLAWASEAGRRRRFLLRLVSLSCLITSVLSYEIAVPLFLANAAFVGWRGRSLRAVPWANLVALGGLVAYKLVTTDRFGAGGNVEGFIAGLVQTFFRSDYPPGLSGLNLRRALEVNYGSYGVLLPATAAGLARRYPSAAALVLSTAGGAIAFGYAVLLARGTSGDAPDRRVSRRLVAAGLAVFALGYAIFLTNFNIQLTPTGVGNRTAAAASLGVALAFAGAFGWIASFLRSPVAGRRLYGALLAIFAASGILVTSILGSFWKTAYDRETAVLADIRARFPTLDRETVLLLDGVCRYVGPAPVFEASWDLAGALQLFYRDPSLKADVVNPTLQVRDDGIHTSEYDWPNRYPYGPNLVVYHPGKKIVRPLPDPESARSYFREVNPDHNGGCPPGWGGWGEILF